MRHQTSPVAPSPAKINQHQTQGSDCKLIWIARIWVARHSLTLALGEHWQTPVLTPSQQLPPPLWDGPALDGHVHSSALGIGLFALFPIAVKKQPVWLCLNRKAFAYSTRENKVKKCKTSIRTSLYTQVTRPQYGLLTQNEEDKAIKARNSSNLQPKALKDPSQWRSTKLRVRTKVE